MSRNNRITRNGLTNGASADAAQVGVQCRWCGHERAADGGPSPHCAEGADCAHTKPDKAEARLQQVLDVVLRWLTPNGIDSGTAMTEISSLMSGCGGGSEDNTFNPQPSTGALPTHEGQ